MNIYTIGYGNKGFEPLLNRLSDALRRARSTRFMVLDVRVRPRSWCRDLTHPNIAKNFHMEGHDYRWCRSLGNNGSVETVSLMNERLGLAELKTILDTLKAHEELVLLCAERDPQRCHRTYIAELAHEMYGLEVVHL